jgi:starvation-inducible outer membrane lipoprotein
MIRSTITAGALALALAGCASMGNIDPIVDTAAEATRIFRCSTFAQRNAEAQAMAQAGKLTDVEMAQARAAADAVSVPCSGANPATAADLATVEANLLIVNAIIDAANRR